MIRDTALNEGRMEGRIRALFLDAGFTIEEIAKKTGKSEIDIKDILESLETDEL